MEQEFSPYRGTTFEKEYPFSTGWKIFLYIMIVAMLMGGTYLTYTSITDKDWWLTLTGIGLAALDGISTWN